MVSSCSSEEHKNNASTKIIVGVWRPIKVVEVYLDGSSHTVETYEGCGINNRWFFYDDGGYDKEEFLKDYEGNCNQDSESFNMVKGSWKKLEENNYTIIITYQDGGTDTERPEITFPNKNTMLLTYDGGEETPEVDYSYHEFSRVE